MSLRATPRPGTCAMNVQFTHKRSFHRDNVSFAKSRERVLRHECPGESPAAGRKEIGAMQQRL